MTQENPKRDSFVFYTTWYEAISSLPEDLRGKALFAIIEYALTGVEPEGVDPVAKAMLGLVKQQIDTNRHRYENALKGGNRKQTKQQPRFDQDSTKAEQTQTEEEQSRTKGQPKSNQKPTKHKPKVNQTSTEEQPIDNQPPTQGQPIYDICNMIYDNKEIDTCVSTKKASEEVEEDRLFPLDELASPQRLEHWSKLFGKDSATILGLCAEIHNNWIAVGQKHQSFVKAFYHMQTILESKIDYANKKSKTDKRRRVEVPTDAEGYYSSF